MFHALMGRLKLIYFYYLFTTVVLENNHRKINTLEEIEIVKAASSKYLLNDVIAGQNEPMYKRLPSSVI